MVEEKTIEPVKVEEELLKDSILQDCGIHRYLFHGTSKDRAHQIAKTNEIKISNEIGYLGCGFYCYLNDVNASKLWARKRFKAEKIACLNVTADLGNVLFICQELNQIFSDKAKEIVKAHVEKLNENVGLLIERFIKEVIAPEYEISINAVSKAYIIDRKKVDRPATMYSLRDKAMIKEVEVHWEET